MSNATKAQELSKELFRIAHVVQPPAEAEFQMTQRVEAALDDASRKRPATSAFVTNPKQG